MTKAEIRFTIDQLRKDKIIYAVEATAFSLACFLLTLFASVFFPEPLRDPIIAVLLLLGAGYTVYMGITNLSRLKHIRRLERLLSSPRSYLMRHI